MVMLPFPPCPPLALAAPGTPPGEAGAAGRARRAQEPDGSRSFGIVPPYRGGTAPPEWLRAASHALAVASSPNTRRYVYEAYTDGSGWLVRYLRLPDGPEPCPETQLAFLFGPDPLDPMDPPRRVDGCQWQVRARRVEWESRWFVLEDRRDLLSPPAPRRR